MKDESGFTLIEVLVAALIVVMLFTASFTILESGMRSWLRGEDRADRQQNVRIVMDRLTREIRQAKAVLDVGTYVNGNKFVQFQDAGDRTVKYLFDEEKKEVRRYVDGSGGTIVGYAITAAEFKLDASKELLEVTLTGEGYSVNSVVAVRVYNL